MVPAPDSPSPITVLLNRLVEGDDRAGADLYPLLYTELRALADGHMRGEREAHTLQPTALVHEAWMRLVDPQDGTWVNRAQFFRMASRVMRSVLVDHARARATLKRGGDRQRHELDEQWELDGTDPDVTLSLNDAMERLQERDPELHEIAELHLFGGLTIEEIARLVESSPSRTERAWRSARVVLQGLLEEA